ncbi:MAG TPA: hypothetical protein VEH31_18075 [Streptosporangiaceae bacterium]|nr:hypothetical protein [Streptosporangiaceae bacterium]
MKPPAGVPEGGKRSAGPAWSKNPAFFAVRQGYLASPLPVSDLLAAGAGDPSAMPRPGSPPFPAGRARAGIVNPPGPKAWYEAAGCAGHDPLGLAHFGHQAPRLVAGGPDDVARPPGRRTRKAACHGQRAAPGHRGRHGRERGRLVWVRQTGSIGGT